MLGVEQDPISHAEDEQAEAFFRFEHNYVLSTNELRTLKKAKSRKYKKAKAIVAKGAQAFFELGIFPIEQLKDSNGEVRIDSYLKFEENSRNYYIDPYGNIFWQYTSSTSDVIDEATIHPLSDHEYIEIGLKAYWKMSEIAFERSNDITPFTPDLQYFLPHPEKAAA